MNAITDPAIHRPIQNASALSHATVSAYHAHGTRSVAVMPL